MDVGVVVKNEATDVHDDLSITSTSLSTSLSVDTLSSTESSSMPDSAALGNQTASSASSTSDCAVDASNASSMGLMPSFITAAPKITDSAGPFKLVVAANSLRPKMSTQVHLPASELSQPTLILGPAVTAPSSSASPRKTVTVLPAGIRSPSQAPLAVISARPVTPAGQAVGFATRSPGKVTVLSLPKTSSVPGRFVTVVPSSGATTAVSTSSVNNKTTALPYKVLVRPSSAVSL